MSKEFEKKIEDLFLHKEKIIDSNMLESIIKQAVNETTINETATVGLKEIDESDILQFLPKFEFTEDVGVKDSLARKMFDSVVGKTMNELPDLRAKISHLQNFCSNVPESAGSEDVSNILSNLVILKMLINIFNRSSYGSAGMQFEAFIAALMGGQQTKRDITSNVLDVTINKQPYQIKVLKNITDGIDMSIQNMDKHFFENGYNTLNFLIIDKMGRDVSNKPSNITGIKFYTGTMEKAEYQRIRPKKPKESRILISQKDFFNDEIGFIEIKKSTLDLYGNLLRDKVRTTLIEVAKLINNINAFYIKGTPDNGAAGIDNAKAIAANLSHQHRTKTLE